MAILHFICDEGGKYRRDRVVSISGIGADRAHLDLLDAEWQVLLRSYGMNELSMRHAMKFDTNVGKRLFSTQTTEERQKEMFPFADCINKYMEIGLMQGWSVVGYAKLPLEVKKLLGGCNDPHQLAFVRGLQEIARYVPEGHYINVLCDDNLPTAWDTYMHYREALKASDIDKNLLEYLSQKAFIFRHCKPPIWLHFWLAKPLGKNFMAIRTIVSY